MRANGRTVWEQFIAAGGSKYRLVVEGEPITFVIRVAVLELTFNWFVGFAKNMVRRTRSLISPLRAIEKLVCPCKAVGWRVFLKASRAAEGVGEASPAHETSNKLGPSWIRGRQPNFATEAFARFGEALIMLTAPGHGVFANRVPCGPRALPRRSRSRKPESGNWRPRPCRVPSTIHPTAARSP